MPKPLGKKTRPKPTRCQTNAIQKGSGEQIELIRDAVTTSGALEYTARLAQAQIEEAIDLLQALPASPYRDSLEQLARFSVDRTF